MIANRQTLPRKEITNFRYKVQNHFTPDKMHFPHSFSPVPKYIFPYTYFPFDIELNGDHDKTVGVGGRAMSRRKIFPESRNNEFSGIRHVNFPGICGAITRFRDARKSCFSWKLYQPSRPAVSRSIKINQRTNCSFNHPARLPLLPLVF